MTTAFPSRPANAAPSDFGAEPVGVTFDEFLAAVYAPANFDLFAKRGRVDPEDLRSEFALSLYRIQFPAGLSPARADRLLRSLAARFVRCRLGDAHRRALVRENPAAKAEIAAAARPVRSAASSESSVARVFAALRSHSEEVTEAFAIALRNPGTPALAERQTAMPARRFREALARARQVAESVGVL